MNGSGFMFGDTSDLKPQAMYSSYYHSLCQENGVLLFIRRKKISPYAS
jgi:hypothetical protein